MASGSSTPGSPASVQATSLNERIAALTGTSTDLTVQNLTMPSQGFAQRPIVQPAVAASADYYRYGAGGLTVDHKLDDFQEQEASIRMVGVVSQNQQDLDIIPPYTKFILETTQESHTERNQIVETFGDFYVFFFGERPPVYNFTGTLINSQNANWVQDFMFYYENYLRGTQCVLKNARLVLTYGGRQIEGFMLNTSNSTAAVTDFGVQFSFQILILDRKYLGFSQDFGVTVLASGKLVQNLTLLNTLKNMSNVNTSGAFQIASDVLNGTTPPASTQLLPAASAESLSAQFGFNIIASPSGGVKLG